MNTAIDPTAAAIVEAATRAPSSHNTQPWRFAVEPERIHLFADRTRALPVNDPDDRELVISCGCALHHLRVAAASLGYSSSFTLFPNPADPDLLATLHLLTPATPANDAAAEFDDAIDARRTYRKRFDPNQVPDAVLEELATAAQAEGAWLAIVSLEDQRHALADLIAEGDATLWANPSWRRELAAWMHPRRTGDGIAVPWIMAPFAHAVIRSFDMGHGNGAKDRQIADESPVLAVLGTAADGPADWLRAGQALSRVLLDACAHHVQASYLNQPIQVPALRPKLQHLLARPGFPQVVLRMGYAADEIPPSPRRPLKEVLDGHPDN